MDERARLLEQLQAATDEVLGPGAMKLDESTELGDGIDSLDVIEIMMIIEEQEEVALEPDAILEVANVAALVDALLALRAASGDRG